MFLLFSFASVLFLYYFFLISSSKGVHYENVKLKFMGIDNIHVMRHAQQKLSVRFFLFFFSFSLFFS